MPVSRMDLADAGSPEKIVSLILQNEPNLSIPVPIEELCRQLDIEDFKDLTSDGFEGGLLTDSERSFGFILVKKGNEGRRRFTIAHELGHFLMPHHIPEREGHFLCSRADMLRLGAKEADRRERMEVEANRFASLILIPPPALKLALKPCREPDLAHIPKLARDFKVSKEAMARAYAQHHEKPIAILVTRHGKVLRCYKHIQFPFVIPSGGVSVPTGSLIYRGPHELNIASDLVECVPDLWIEVKRGERAPTLYEQVYAQREGFALIMLHLECPDEDAEAEERDLEESWRVGFRGKRR
jgi:Zn-dependent peptidase ImmA (M78 family)